MNSFIAELEAPIEALYDYWIVQAAGEKGPKI